MTKFFKNFFILSAALALTSAGCATTRPKPADPTDLSVRVTQLEEEVKSKDMEIEDLEAQLSSYQDAIRDTGATGGGTSKYIRVPGVSVKDVQKALSKAGFEPGPIDGRMGKKTKSAIKAFQRKKGLHADGIVGEKTWALLKK